MVFNIKCTLTDNYILFFAKWQIFFYVKINFEIKSGIKNKLSMERKSRGNNR